MKTEKRIRRLEQALEQGDKGATYCFDCDEITTSSWVPEECWEHDVVSSDGVEHDGISAAITALQHDEK